METIREQMLLKLNNHLDMYHGILAGQAVGDEHREMEQAQQLAKILQINLETYEEERNGKSND
jgi:hypothetical protein